MKSEARWLVEISGGPWSRLAEAQRAGLPVPNGFTATQNTAEGSIRSAYETLKQSEHTHFVAARGCSPSQTELDVLGPDRLILTMRRFWQESPETEILVQRMVHATWCGKAGREGKNLRIRANQGMRILDPDIYLLNTGTGKCTRRTLYQRPRKMFRWIDGTSKTEHIEGKRRPLETKFLQGVADLAGRAQADIAWALDDRGVWLLNML